MLTLALISLHFLSLQKAHGLHHKLRLLKHIRASVLFRNTGYPNQKQKKTNKKKQKNKTKKTKPKKTKSLKKKKFPRPKGPLVKPMAFSKRQPRSPPRQHDHDQPRVAPETHGEVAGFFSVFASKCVQICW